MSSPTPPPPPPPPPPSPLTLGLVALLTFVVGLLGALQGTFNTRAGAHFRIQILGTAISFGGGLLLLTAGAAFEVWRSSSSSPTSAPLPCLRWSRRPSPWLLLPGTLGVLFVTASIVLSAVVGYALFYVPAVVGQLVGAAAIDHVTGRARLTARVALLLALAALGAALSVLDRLQNAGAAGGAGGDEGGVGAVVGSVLVALVVGSFMPGQATLNRRAAEILPSRLQATWWSFFTGTLSACVATGIQMAVQTDDTRRLWERTADSEWFMWFGGPLGVIYIASTIWCVGLLGAARYFVCLMGGQLCGAAILDAVGAFGSPVRPAGPARGAGIALVILAAAAIQLGGGGGSGAGGKTTTIGTCREWCGRRRAGRRVAAADEGVGEKGGGEEDGRRESGA
jgi:bacterial/archaeal transporter family-2 protein